MGISENFKKVKIRFSNFDIVENNHECINLEEKI